LISNETHNVGTVYREAGIGRGETRTALEGACNKPSSFLNDEVEGEGKSMVDEKIDAQQCGGQQKLHVEAHLDG
jgi:hypothetical protein